MLVCSFAFLSTSSTRTGTPMTGLGSSPVGGNIRIFSYDLGNANSRCAVALSVPLHGIELTVLAEQPCTDPCPNQFYVPLVLISRRRRIGHQICSSGSQSQDMESIQITKY